ncbi:MAG: 3-dehydroquinate synthase [Nocardioidaceae bacterium]
MTDQRRIRVSGAAPYDVVVGHGLLAELPSLLGHDVARVAVIHPATMSELCSTVVDSLEELGFAVWPILVPDAERAKTSTVAAQCWDALGRAGFSRSDALVGVGGGATTDLAGFVAATFLRGITVVHIPTTLLGMVDAAVGGKTGINTAAGKNLVGAFHEPAGVLCDLANLATLDRREVVNGLAEVVKCGFIADPRILDLVEAGHDRLADSETTRELIERAIEVKAHIVSTDLRETTSRGRSVGREALNYGHTMGHAIERVERYTWRHGEAVAVGMVYVAEVARLAGHLDDDTADRHRRVLAAVGLPTAYRGDRWSELRDAMRVDKKTRGDTLRLVILERLGRPAILAAPDPELLIAAYEAISSPD